MISRPFPASTRPLTWRSGASTIAVTCPFRSRINFLQYRFFPFDYNRSKIAEEPYANYGTLHPSIHYVLRMQRAITEKRRIFMTSEVRPIPEDYHTATPYLIVKEPVKAIEFYKKALGATELMRLTDAEGKIRHAE